MTVPFKSSLAALAAQTAVLPFILGGGSLAELFGWGIILGLLFALPSIAVYFPLFSLLYRLNLPRWLTITLAATVPLLVCIAVYLPKPNLLSIQNYVIWMALVGGATGGYVLTRLRSVT